jgi:DNA-binding transcriptional LysR family regulator
MTDWDAFRFFLAGARRGSIRAAAADLGVNHSTVSRRIDAFEKKLDVRVFERLPSGYFLTQAGEEMLQSAERVEQETTTAERRVAGRDARLSGLLRVTLPDSLAQKLLMPDLVAFSEAHPEIDLELDVTSSMADLARREADVAIRLSNDPPGYLVGRRLLKYAKAIYASKAYLTRHDLLDGADKLRWIGWNDTVPDPQWVRESPYPQAPARNRIGSSMVQLEATKAGMGLGLLPCYMGDTEPALRRLPPGKPIPDRDIWLLTHEDLRHTARVRRFLDSMAEAILAKRGLLEGGFRQEDTALARP